MVEYTKGRKWKNKWKEGFKVFLPYNLEIHVSSDLPYDGMGNSLYCLIELHQKLKYKHIPYNTLKSRYINLLDENDMKINEVIDIMILDACQYIRQIEERQKNACQ